MRIEDEDILKHIKRIMNSIIVYRQANGEVKPIKNTSRHDCYEAIYKIKEILGQVDEEDNIRGLSTVILQFSSDKEYTFRLVTDMRINQNKLKITYLICSMGIYRYMGFDVGIDTIKRITILPIVDKGGDNNGDESK